MTADDLAAIIRARREALGIGQRGLAAHVGMTYTAVSMWESGGNLEAAIRVLTALELLGVELRIVPLRKVEPIGSIRRMA